MQMKASPVSKNMKTNAGKKEETALKERRHSLVCSLLALLILVSAAVRAATFTSSLPLEPAELAVPFGETVTVTLPGGLLDLPELPDNEYYGEVSYEYHWSVPGGPSGNGRTATIPSSAAGGSGVIASPGNHTVVFTGKATYTVRWMEGNVEHSSETQEVALTASEGGRLSLPFRLVGVASVSCEGITSTTATPDTNETLVIPVGYNNGSVTLTATPTPSGAWPYGKPAWDGNVLSSNGATATLSTAEAGTYTVTASCGNTVGLTVQVIGVSELTARRKGTEDAFGASATIAAGGKSSDVHKAEMKIQLWPIPVKQASLEFPASLSGAAAHQGTAVAAILTCGASTLAGNSSGTVTLSEIDLSTGTAAAELKSSNVTRNCTATIGGSSVNVGMVWDVGGSVNFEYDDYFIPGESEEIFFYPTLDEISGEDVDSDGIAGEGVINGHSMLFKATAITVSIWAYDWEEDEYIENSEETITIVPGQDPEIAYGVYVSDLIEIGATTETDTGKYKSIHTVYDWYEVINDNIDFGIDILEYSFDAYDTEVFVR